MTLYSKFPDSEAALAEESLEYFAMLAGKECLGTKVFEGAEYLGRVHHTSKITQADYDSARHY